MCCRAVTALALVSAVSCVHNETVVWEIGCFFTSVDLPVYN